MICLCRWTSGRSHRKDLCETTDFCYKAKSLPLAFVYFIAQLSPYCIPSTLLPVACPIHVCVLGRQFPSWKKRH